MKDLSHFGEVGKVVENSTDDRIEFDDWSLFIILNKIFDKLMNKYLSDLKLHNKYEHNFNDIDRMFSYQIDKDNI